MHQNDHSKPAYVAIKCLANQYFTCGCCCGGGCCWFGTPKCCKILWTSLSHGDSAQIVVLPNTQLLSAICALLASSRVEYLHKAMPWFKYNWNCCNGPCCIHNVRNVEPSIWAVIFFKSSQVDGHAPEPLVETKTKEKWMSNKHILIYVNFMNKWICRYLLRRKLPPIQPFVLELVAVEVIEFAPPRFPLFVFPKPGGGPRAVLFVIGALHSSDWLLIWCDTPSDQLFPLELLKFFKQKNWMISFLLLFLFVIRINFIGKHGIQTLWNVVGWTSQLDWNSMWKTIDLTVVYQLVKFCCSVRTNQYPLLHLLIMDCEQHCPV